MESHNFLKMTQQKMSLFDDDAASGILQTQYNQVLTRKNEGDGNQEFVSTVAICNWMLSWPLGFIHGQSLRITDPRYFIQKKVK